MTVEATVNVGNLIPLFIAVVGLIVWLSRLGSAQKSTDEKVDELRQHREKHDHRLRNVEMIGPTLSARFDGFMQMLNDIRNDIRDMKGRQ